MEIFIICCLLFIRVNMCIYVMHMFIESPYFSYYVVIQSGFRVSIRVLGIRGFGFGDGLSPESVFGAVLGFGLRFRVRVHRDTTRSESAPLPSLRGEKLPPERRSGCGRVWSSREGMIGGSGHGRRGLDATTEQARTARMTVLPHGGRAGSREGEHTRGGGGASGIS